MAWIYKRGSKWWIGWRAQDGKLVQKSLKTTKKADAETELARLGLIEQAHAAKAITSDFIAAITGKTAERKKTVAEYFDAWLVNARAHLAHGTIQKYEQLALSHLFPSGFEIINDRMQAAGQDAASSGSNGTTNPVTNSLLPAWMTKTGKFDMSFDYRDIRDDRVYTYFSMPPLSQKLFRMHANAAYRGRFYLPSIKVEAMYDGSISALVPGFWLGIGEKGTGK